MGRDKCCHPFGVIHFQVDRLVASFRSTDRLPSCDAFGIPCAFGTSDPFGMWDPFGMSPAMGVDKCGHRLISWHETAPEIGSGAGRQIDRESMGIDGLERG